MLKKQPRDRAQLIEELNWWTANTGAAKPKPSRLKSMGDGEIQSLLIELRGTMPMPPPITKEENDHLPPPTPD